MSTCEQWLTDSSLNWWGCHLKGWWILTLTFRYHFKYVFHGFLVMSAESPTRASSATPTNPRNMVAMVNQSSSRTWVGINIWSIWSDVCGIRVSRRYVFGHNWWNDVGKKLHTHSLFKLGDKKKWLDICPPSKSRERWHIWHDTYFFIYYII